MNIGLRLGSIRWNMHIGCGVFLLAVVAARGQHQGDVWVGVTTSGQLAASSNGFIPNENYHTLTPVDGLIKGWSDTNPGFDHVVSGSKVIPMSPGADIWLEVVATDPAFETIDDGFQFLHNPGDDTELGNDHLHQHLTFHINNQDPAFDDSQCVWHATFILRDDGSTGYATSNPLTFSFTNVAIRPAGNLADGDFNEDGDINADDFAALAVCLDGGGPQHVPQPADANVTTCEVECLNAFDFDDDHDVDLQDMAAMQQLMP